MVELLPHFGAACNLAITALIIGAFVAIRRGDRALHPRLMKAALVIGALFLVSYLAQVALLGHGEAPGEGWVKTAFLVILATHTLAAVLMLPLVLRSAYLGMQERFAEHRRWVRFAYPVWLYVGITGVVVYVMIYHVPGRV